MNSNSSGVINVSIFGGAESSFFNQFVIECAKSGFRCRAVVTISPPRNTLMGLDCDKNIGIGPLSVLARQKWARRG